VAAVAAFLVLFQALKDSQKTTSYAGQEARSAATAAMVAREQFEATQRAWIGVDSVEVKNVTQIPKSSYYSFSVFVNGKNFGHVPAKNVEVTLDIADSLGQLAEKAKTICRGSRFATRKTDVTLFPDKTFPFSLAGAVSIHGTSFQPQWLIGCFIYGDDFRKCETIENCRYTRFCYMQTQETEGLPKYALYYRYNDAK
jgi:hypothetical protein